MKRLKLINKGVSLYEVLLVLVIISILLILSFVAYRSQIAKANDAKSKNNINNIQLAVESYEKDNNCYPETLPSCGEGFGQYLDKVPCIPSTGASYVYYAEPDHPACPSWYWIFLDLDYDNDPTIDELGCTYGCGPSEATAAFNYYEQSPSAPDPYANAGPPDPDPTIVPPPPPSGFYGCFSGSCTGIAWDPDRPGPACDPNFSNSTCFGLCVDGEGGPQNECIPW